MRPSVRTGTSSEQALGQSCGQADLARRDTNCCMQPSCSVAGLGSDRCPPLLPAGLLDGPLPMLQPVLSPKALAFEEVERGPEHPASDGLLSIPAVFRPDILGGSIPD